LRIAAALAALASVLALLAGCGTLNVVAEGGDSKLMLNGNDPVAYFSSGTATRGRADIKAQYEGASYRFTSDENRRQFITSPTRFAPQFGGFSAQQMAYAVPSATDAATFKIIEGRLYLFENPRTRLLFEMDQERNLRAANQYWEAEVRDGGSWQMQAWKRLLWRVPGYKSESDLVEEYERRFGRKPN
jgi:YHS domain-containing protein